MDLDHLPRILERKRTLAGAEKTFPCRVLDRAAGALCVLFVSERGQRVADLDLPPGTVTFGHFWVDRPYNVYHWMSPDGATLAHYYNIASETVLGDDGFSFLDLAVDLLARPGGPPAILDADEVPPDLDPATRTALSQGLATALADLPTIAPALEERADQLWPRVFARPRR